MLNIRICNEIITSGLGISYSTVPKAGKVGSCFNWDQRELQKLLTLNIRYCVILYHCLEDIASTSNITCANSVKRLGMCIIFVE